jgi:hypothetical protein
MLTQGFFYNRTASFQGDNRKITGSFLYDRFAAHKKKRKLDIQVCFAGMNIKFSALLIRRRMPHHINETVRASSPRRAPGQAGKYQIISA